MHDCHEAMVKIKMAFRPTGQLDGSGKGGVGGAGEGLVLVDMDLNATNAKGGKGGDNANNNMNVTNFGEYYTQDIQGPIGGMLVEPVLLMDPNDDNMMGHDGFGGGGAFAIPFSLDPTKEGEAGENWIVAEEDEEEMDNNDEGAGGRRRRGRRDQATMSTAAAANLTLDSDMSGFGVVEEEEEEEGWAAFDPEADEKADDEEEDDNMHVFQPDGGLDADVEAGRDSIASRVELVRGANDSVASDRLLQVCFLPI